MAISDQRPSILIADDSGELRQFLTQLLASEGYGTQETASLEETEAFLATQHADLVLTDSFGATPALVENSATRILRAAGAAPVILISGHALDDAAQQLLRDLGVAAYLPKPFDIDAVLEQVRRHLRAEAGLMHGGLGGQERSTHRRAVSR